MTASPAMGAGLPRGAAEALARASAALVAEHDVQGFLVSLLRSCADVLEIDASAVMVHDSNGLEVLSASSHVAEELELHQMQASEGPCHEAYVDGRAVAVSGADEVVARWPTFGPVLTGAGFLGAYSMPLTWRGEPVGAMGMFRRTDVPLSAEEEQVARAFADIATLVVAQEPGISINERIDDALVSRVSVEVAKGVIAELDGVDMAEAYARLVDRAEGAASLTAVARQIILEAQGQQAQG